MMHQCHVMMIIMITTSATSATTVNCEESKTHLEWEYCLYLFYLPPFLPDAGSGSADSSPART